MISRVELRTVLLTFKYEFTSPKLPQNMYLYKRFALINLFSGSTLLTQFLVTSFNMEVAVRPDRQHQSFLAVKF